MFPQHLPDPLLFSVLQACKHLLVDEAAACLSCPLWPLRSRGHREPFCSFSKHSPLGLPKKPLPFSPSEPPASFPSTVPPPARAGPRFRPAPPPLLSESPSEVSSTPTASSRFYLRARSLLQVPVLQVTHLLPSHHPRLCRSQANHAASVSSQHTNSSSPPACSPHRRSHLCREACSCPQLELIRTIPAPPPTDAAELCPSRLLNIFPTHHFPHLNSLHPNQST